MKRALVVAVLICVYGFSLPNVTTARWTVPPNRRTTITKISTTTPAAVDISSSTTKASPEAEAAGIIATDKTTVSPAVLSDFSVVAASNAMEDNDNDNENVDDEHNGDISKNDELETDRTYHPAEVKQPRLIERVDQRHHDGHYEYRYVLSNGDARYERAYWKPTADGQVILARKGYYSYPMPNQQFLTVHYTADEFGYHVDSSVMSRRQPTLERRIEVPEHDPPPTAVTTATNSWEENRKNKKRRPVKTTHKRRTRTTVSPQIENDIKRRTDLQEDNINDMDLTTERVVMNKVKDLSVESVKEESVTVVHKLEGEDNEQVTTATSDNHHEEGTESEQTFHTENGVQVEGVEETATISRK